MKNITLIALLLVGANAMASQYTCKSREAKYDLEITEDSVVVTAEGSVTFSKKDGVVEKDSTVFTENGTGYYATVLTISIPNLILAEPTARKFVSHMKYTETAEGASVSVIESNLKCKLVHL